MAGSPSHAPTRGSAAVRTQIGPWLEESLDDATAPPTPEPSFEDWPTRAEMPPAGESPTPTESEGATPESPPEVAAQPEPPPPTVMNASCAAVPGEPAGWARRVTSTFDETTPLGAWPGPIAAQAWFARQAGANDSSGRGTYDANRTVTEHDGVVDVFIHSEGIRRYVAALVAAIGDTVGQRITICMRADRIPGYKLAFLLWPGQGTATAGARSTSRRGSSTRAAPRTPSCTTTPSRRATRTRTAGTRRLHRGLARVYHRVGPRQPVQPVG